MFKKFATRALFGGVILASISLITFGAFSMSWFVGPNINSEDHYLDGDIGLRNYFFAGDGTEENPYEIVSPMHLYNLSRLQNLGIFAGKTYFKVGHTFDIEGVPSVRCINEYDNEGNPIYEEFLDMGELSEQVNIATIGGEGVPFLGIIDGQGLPIKNLKVYGNPEDVGVFGYVGYEGRLHGLVFDNLEVTSLGYNNNASDPDNQLFSEDIDDIFHSASYLATDTSLSLYDFNSVTEDYDVTNLKKLNGASGTQLANINSNNNVVSDTKYFNGYFKPSFPNVENDRFTYSILSSSPVIRTLSDLELDLQGGSEKDLALDLTPLYDSTDFNKGNPYQLNARIYLIASVVVDGHTFSRVIQSYTIEIYSNSSAYEDGRYSAGIFCDYVDQGDASDKNTGYHHGTNVGLIAGHVDGSLKDCYVFNGTIKFNETGYHPIAAETDTALVGEIDKNVRNDIDPDIGLVVKGDIGVMNFSKIYSLIRDDMTPQTIKAGQRTAEGTTTTYNYVSYKKFVNQESIGLFEDYLRYYDGKKEEQEFITGTDTNVGSGVWKDYNVSTIPEDFNSVDFLWNRVVEDEEDVDRGLGVFKIISSYNSAAMSGSYGTYMVNNMKDCRIINGSPKSKVYFSTAEYDHNKDNEGMNWTDSTIIPKRGTDLPTYSDVLSFDYPFSRDFNYCFELDLSQMDASSGNDYMYNNNSPFLTNYLSSKLIDKYGSPVTPGSARFGFMFRSSENESLSSLSSYMPVGKPGNKHAFTTSTGETKYFPSNSIVFSIDNPNGANVSVVGNNANITIYSNDSSSSEGAIDPLYTMKSENNSGDDMHRYFTYDVASGDVSPTTVVNNGAMGDAGVLYGHIFKLPKGEYILGSDNDKKKANVYFLAVQGQSDGTIGTNETITLDQAIEDVDFLLTAPTFVNYPAGLDKALFSYSGVFNTSSGVITNDYYAMGDNRYMRVAFNNSPIFVTQLHLRSRKVEHVFMFNGQLIDSDMYSYMP